MTKIAWAWHHLYSGEYTHFQRLPLGALKSFKCVSWSELHWFSVDYKGTDTRWEGWSFCRWLGMSAAIVSGLVEGTWSNLIFLPRVDKDRSGVISDSELQQALSNGKYRASLFLPPFTCDVWLPSFCLLLFHLLSSVLLCCQHSLLFHLLDLFLLPVYTLALLWFQPRQEMVRDFIFILPHPAGELKYTNRIRSYF